MKNFALVVLLVLAVKLPIFGSSYSMIDIGTGWQGASYACGINDSSQVIVRVDDYVNSSYRSYLWENGIITDLGTLGGMICTAEAINEAGYVIGNSTDLNGVIRPFLWHDNVMNDIGFPSMLALALNNNNQVLLYSEGRSYLWENNNLTDITIKGYHCKPESINDNGDIILSAYLANTSRGFLVHEGTVIDLGNLGDLHAYCGPQSINNNGIIVGYSAIDYGANRGFIWNNGVMTDLGTLGGPESLAYDINISGTVVGSSWIWGSHVYRATVWKDGIIEDIGSKIVAGEDYIESEAFAINNDNIIVGKTGTIDYKTHAAIWIPKLVPDPDPIPEPEVTPEPPGLLVICGGITGFFVFCRRKR